MALTGIERIRKRIKEKQYPQDGTNISADIKLLIKSLDYWQKEYQKVSHYEQLSKERLYWLKVYRLECYRWRRGVAKCIHCKEKLL